MNKLIYILAFLILGLPCRAVDTIDVDYKFIDNAFNGIKAVSDKEFNDTINKMTLQPAPTTFGGKVKAFLFGRQRGVETPANEQKDEKFDNGGDKKAIEDIKNGVSYITLGASIIGEGGKVIPLGNYKIKQKDVNGEHFLAFYQGHGEYGMLKLARFNDTMKKQYDITYSRVDVLSDDMIRIVYSTIDDTQCAIARVYSENLSTTGY